MAKIAASLADVSTEFVPADPGVYRFEIDKVEEKEKESRITYQINSKIVSVVSGTGEDSIGKTVVDFIAIHKKDGSINQYGLVQLKRYFEAILGKENVEARGDDLDTDELKGGFFVGEIGIESYKANAGQPNEEERFKNVFKTIQPDA
jgi:hypothetical protein